MSPHRRRLLRRFALPMGLILLLVVLRRLPQSVVPASRDPQQLITVRRVVDGDTLILAGGQRVRMLGIDTPELERDGQSAEPWSESARDFLRESVEGRDVSLGFDQEAFDKYGRQLAYVYLQGTLINEEVIRAGFSPAKTGYPYSAAMKSRFRRAEREAKEHRRGLWSEVSLPD